MTFKDTNKTQKLLICDSASSSAFSRIALRVTVSHPRVTVSHLRVTVSHPRVTVSHPRVTVSHPRGSSKMCLVSFVTKSQPNPV